MCIFQQASNQFICKTLVPAHLWCKRREAVCRCLSRQWRAGKVDQLWPHVDKNKEHRTAHWASKYICFLYCHPNISYMKLMLRRFIFMSAVTRMQLCLCRPYPRSVWMFFFQSDVKSDLVLVSHVPLWVNKRTCYIRVFHFRLQIQSCFPGRL